MRLPLIEAGQIVTTHGVRGEVKLLCYLDEPSMLSEYRRCCIDGKEYEMESVRVQKTCNLVKLRGVVVMYRVAQLVNYDIVTQMLRNLHQIEAQRDVVFGRT